jgi:hypothetical protein
MTDVTSGAGTAYPSGAPEFTPVLQPSIKEIMRDIYTPYAGAAGILLHINGKFTMEKLKSSLLS